MENEMFELLDIERLYGEVKQIKSLLDRVQVVVLNRDKMEDERVRLGYNLSKLEDCVAVLHDRIEKIARPF